MNFYFTFIFFFIAVFIKSQAGFNVIYEADYKLTYKSQKINSITQEATYALLINENESYYKNLNKYIGDSLMYEKKLNENSDLGLLMKYYGAEFNENIGTTSNKFYVTLETSNKDFKYEELNSHSLKR